MSTVQENPCLACSENQRCCSQLSGLRLSKEEFEKYFRYYSNGLSITEDNKVFIVSSHDNGPCPHWDKSGCKIYDIRPTDCRVYPYEVIGVVERKKVIEITFRDSLCCPQRDHLLMPIEEARALMEVFGRTVYGQGKPVVTKYVQKEKDSAEIFSLFAPLMERLFELIKGHRKKG
jgi:Fe-S-cluster containining protein